MKLKSLLSVFTISIVALTSACSTKNAGPSADPDK